MIAAISGLVGGISMMQIFTLQSTIHTIGDEYWPVANGAMETRIGIGKQLVVVHEYMLGETEGRLESFWELDQEARQNIASIGAIIGNDSILLVNTYNDYEDHIEIVNGTGTIKGVFQLMDDNWADESALNTKLLEFLSVHEEIKADLITIEENTDVETGNWNVSVADYSMNMNIFL